jgi:hypothetical protein
MKGSLDQLFELELADRSAADSKQLRVPSLEERVELYLRAVYGDREFTNEEYSRARSRMLDAMAAHLAAKSGGIELGPETLPREANPQPAEIHYSLEITSLFAASTVRHRIAVPERTERALKRFESALVMQDETSALVVQDETRLARPPTRRLTTRRISIFAVAVAASVALLLFVVTPIVWPSGDQSSIEPRIALAPVAPVASGPAPMMSAEPAVSPAAPLASGPAPMMSTEPAVSPAAPAAPPMTYSGAPAASAVNSAKKRQNPARTQTIAVTDATPEEIAKAVKRGLELLAQGEIKDARELLLRWAAEKDATAALALGTSYDPVQLEKLLSERGPATAVRPVASLHVASPKLVDPNSFADIAMARTWYQKAKDLGSTEAGRRLESLAARESGSR